MIDRSSRPPRELTPAFYGCFDWHSAVHGHWTLVRALHCCPDASWGARVRLWGWRREPARRAVAARLGTVLSLGLHAPQQWVCESPTPMLVTLATLTRS